MEQTKSLALAPPSPTGFQSWSGDILLLYHCKEYSTPNFLWDLDALCPPPPQALSLRQWTQAGVHTDPGVTLEWVRKASCCCTVSQDLFSLRVLALCEHLPLSAWLSLEGKTCCPIHRQQLMAALGTEPPRIPGPRNSFLPPSTAVNKSKDTRVKAEERVLQVAAAKHPGLALPVCLAGLSSTRRKEQRV